MQSINQTKKPDQRSRFRRTRLFLLVLLCAGTAAQAQTTKGTDIASCTLTGYISNSVLLPSSTNGIGLQSLICDTAGNAYLRVTLQLPGNTFLGLTRTSPDSRNSSTLTKFAPDGTILWNVFSPYANPGYKLDGNYLYGYSPCSSLASIPGITGPLAGYAGAGFIMTKIDAATGANMGVLGLAKTTDVPALDIPTAVKNDITYFAYQTRTTTLPVTDGSTFSGTICLYAGKMNSAGTLLYGSYVTPLASGDYPLTTGLTVNEDGSMNIRTLYNLIRLDPSGGVVYNAAQADAATGTSRKLLGDESGQYTILSNTAGEIRCSKTDISGNSIYNSVMFKDVVAAEPFYSDIRLQGNYMYSFLYTYFDGSGTNNIHIVKMDKTTGAVIYDAKVPANTSQTNFSWDVDTSGNVWVSYGYIVAASTTMPPITPGGMGFKGVSDIVVIGYNGSGDIIYSTFLGGSGMEGNSNRYSSLIAAKKGRVFVLNVTRSIDFPFTKGTGMGSPAWTSFDFNPDMSAAPNVISTPVSSVCKLGAGAMLNGNKMDLSMAPNVPLLYRNSSPEAQTGILSYQWQQSTDSSSWSNIAGATAQNYLPKSTSVTMYYRRNLTSGAGCSTVLSTSNVIKIAINGLVAPAVAPVVASGYTTCPGKPVNIALNISGGLPPYSVVWDNSTATLSAMSTTGTPATATATPTQSTVYTATVTDANGCIQYGQASVMALSAGTNFATYKCGTDSVLIGSGPVAAGVTGITYAWTPTTGLACSSCSQTKSSVTGNKTLTVTVPITGGGTCSTSMVDTIKAVTAPAAGFAGPDLVLCSPANVNTNLSATIGKATTPGAAYTYTWSPGNYLTTNNSFNATLKLGSVLPVPNPLTYFLTATTTSGCRFVDTMIVGVLRADAGIDGCGPRMVGNPVDPTPGIKGKTYSWTRIDNGAGAASFQTGADTTQIATYVTAGGIDTRFLLTVKDAKGNICTDTVLVTADCGCVNSRIDLLNPIGCPQYAGATPVRLWVNMGGYTNNNLVYDWSPKAGLDRYDSSVVTLTDAVDRTYTVLVKDISTGEVLCTVSREVNGIGWSMPVFAVNDTTLCPVSGTATQVINVGRPAVAAYNYSWTGSGLSATNIANPSVTINSAFTSNKYTVTVTDKGSGCIARDTFTVSVTPVVANAGPDQLVCGSAVTKLANGVDSMTNYAYAWTPASDWKDGSDSSWLHAHVAVATDIDYVLQATDLRTGCSATDTMHIFAIPPDPLTISSSSAVLCKGTSTTLTAPLFGDAAYTWVSSNPAETMPATAVGLNKITVSPQSATTYTVSVNYGAACGQITNSITIAVTDLSYTPAVHNDYCPAASPATITLGPGTAPTSGTAPYTYNWVPNASVNTPATLTTTLKIAPKVNTNYQLTITDATGCAATVTETVNVVPGSKPISGASRTICLGTTTTLGDAGNGDVTWFAAAAPASTTLLSSATDPAPVFTPTAAGTYKYYVQYTSGSCVNPDTVVITVNAQPALAATGATLCSGAGSFAAIGAAAVTGVRYNWSPVTGLDNPNAAQTVVRTTTSAVYTLTATDAAGCQSSVNVPVMVDTTLAPSVAVPALSYCLADGSGQFMTTVNGAVPASKYTAVWTPANYLSSATNIRPQMNSITAGTYNYFVIVTDQSTGCMVQTPATAVVSDCSNIIVPLAIKLLSFNAQPQNKQALLTWVTAPDQSAAFFEVQSSADGSSWQQIGKVNAASDRSGNNISYSFVDEMPQANTVYYRLKMVELSSTYEYSMVRPVQFGGVRGNNQITWYPNPSHGQITVKTTAGIAQVRIMDLSGRVIFQQAHVTDGAVLSLSENLSAGIYMISFESEGSLRTDKLILTK